MDLDDLLKKFDQMDRDIEDDVSTIVRNNTIELTEATIKSERERFDKGYYTGNTARLTNTHKEDKLHWKTVVGSSYAGYLEYGTRFYQGAVGFLYQPFFKQKQKMKEDLERLMKG